MSARGTFKNVLGTCRNVITYATLRRAPRGHPGRVGWLPRCVRTDGRVEVCAKMVPALVEPRTFVQWVLKEEHLHQTFGQWRRNDRMANLVCPRPRPTMRVPCNDRPCNRCGRGCLSAPSTDRIPPAGTLPPVVSNVRFTNYLLGFLIDSARVGPRSRRGMLSTIIEPLEIDLVPLGASQMPTHKPPRRCVASV